jgi:hypothetical protein
MSFDGAGWPECAAPDCGVAGEVCPDGLCYDCCDDAGHDHSAYGGMWADHGSAVRSSP